MLGLDGQRLGVFADSGHTNKGVLVAELFFSAGVGGWEMTRWQLVPPMPKEDTPAMRGCWGATKVRVKPAMG